MNVPKDYRGPHVEILIRDLKQDNTNEVIEKVLSNIRSRPAKIGLFLKDQEDGDLTAKVLKTIDEKGFVKTEMKDFMDSVSMVKLKLEIDSTKMACNFLDWNFKNIIGEVEYIIDEEKKVKHSSISKKIEGMQENSSSFNKFCEKNGVQPELFDYPIPMLI